MMRRIDLRGRLARGEALDYRALVPRAEFDVEAAIDEVRPIVQDVRHRGVEALLDIASLDGVEITDLRVPQGALASAREQLDPELQAAFEESIRRLRVVSEAELERDPTVEVAPGGRVTQRLVPYRRIGLYIPGGIAPLASTVAMNVVPAQVAGVESIALASPAQKEFGGLPHPTILAVCSLLGIDEVYAIGGVGAVAMFAYGTEQCPAVDFVAGPGRITTVAAKRLLKGVVGIDSEAGPTEIAILADDTADPAYVAADLISQAEHDPMAASVLVTPSESLAVATERELEHQVPAAKHNQRITAALSGEQSGIVLVDDLEQGLAVVDSYAAEHLEIHTEDAEIWASRVRNAGAIFIGPWAPVSLGDYCAGSNHVLPTGGCACHSSGLSVRSYLKAVHVIAYDQGALRDVAGHVVAMADAEDLPAHGTAVQVRFAGQPGSTGHPGSAGHSRFTGHPDGYA
ncbi:histidinol dehydrogenase [Actinopolymorpha sp. B17G11]|uniref:histidinol dehydrogenase n=1 Tax=unclassified Actinopolymorpha TaxID=2627063 RepID=UPI0032D937C4